MKKNDPLKLYSITEFCALAGITQPTFRKMRREGYAPKIIRVGRRIIMSTEAVKEWQKKYEK